MNLYRFSPIDSKDALLGAIEYVAVQCSALFQSQDMKIRDNLIKSLTVFSHYLDEYEHLKDISSELGTIDREHNGPFYKLSDPISIEMAKPDTGMSLASSVEYFRIRKPDPYRGQVGCCDFEVTSSEKKSMFDINSDNDRSPRLITRPDIRMLEFFDPDLDVLGYIVK